MEECFRILNERSQYIKLTREQPKDGWLPYLNAQIKLRNGIASVKWYRKESSKNILINAKSAHPNGIKKAIILNMVKTTTAMCTEDREREESLKLATSIASSNGYSRLKSNTQSQTTNNTVRIPHESRIALCISFVSDSLTAATHRTLLRAQLQDDDVVLVNIPNESITRHRTVVAHTYFGNMAYTMNTINIFITIIAGVSSLKCDVAFSAERELQEITSELPKTPMFEQLTTYINALAQKAVGRKPIHCEKVLSSSTKASKAHNLKGQLHEGSMESLTTTIHFVTLKCRTLASELQQSTLSKLLRYLCVPFAALQKSRMRDRPVISIKNYTVYCGDADENRVGGCAIAVRKDYNNLVKEFGSTSSRCAFLRLWDRRGRKFLFASTHAPTETAEDSKDAFYDELNVLMSKIPSKQVVVVGVDANAKMVLEQQSYVLGKWCYPPSDRLMRANGPHHRFHVQMESSTHQLTWHGSTHSTPEEQRKREMRTLELQLRSCEEHSSVSFKIQFHKRNRGVPLQPKIDVAGLKDEECRTKFRQRVSINVGVRTRKKLSDADSFAKCIHDAAKETLPVLLPWKKFAFASAEAKSTYNSVCVARSTGDFNQEKRLRRKLRSQLQQDRDNEWNQERRSLKRRGRTRTL
ncbi:hypothetical protein RB195_002267 [Necator americanus]|uniref:Helix-turn-helix domain-containing protein n=1 Tax=Necator americanus TaxID=51031 RepID=A0ABR1DI72_NECAM